MTQRATLTKVNEYLERQTRQARLVEFGRFSAQIFFLELNILAKKMRQRFVRRLIAFAVLFVMFEKPFADCFKLLHSRQQTN